MTVLGTAAVPTHALTQLVVCCVACWRVALRSAPDFCCHTASEKATIKQVIKDLEWAPFNLTFGKAQCNAGPGTYASPGGGAACSDALTLRAVAFRRRPSVSVCTG